MAQEAAAEKRPDQDLKELAGLGEEFAKYLEVTDMEREKKLEITRCLQEAQSAFSKEVRLDARPLKKWFPGADGAVLENGTNLVITKGKTKTMHSVLELEPDPYLAVVKALGTVVSKLAAEADKERAAEVKPVIQVFTRLKDSRVGAFDWRDQDLTLANIGGGAKKVRLSLSAEGREWYGPVDVDSMETVEISLVRLRKVKNSKVLKIEAWCEDVDGRGYSGKVELEPNSKAVRIFPLSADDPET